MSEGEDLKQLLHKSVRVAYQRELEQVFLATKVSFDRFASGELDVWQIKQRFSELNDTTLRTLETTYSMAEPRYALAYAVKKGVVSPSELPQPVQVAIADLLNTEKM